MLLTGAAIVLTMSLTAAANRIDAGRLCVDDLDTDGLTSEGGDVVYESGAVQTIFTGHPGAQQLNDASYRQRVLGADQRYSRMVTVLINALKQSPTR